MTTVEKKLPLWILIVSGLFALLEFFVSLSLIISPESVLETVDHSAIGVEFLIYMWATRQFALGFIFAFSTFKQSIPMLTITYTFFLVMLIGDIFIGMYQNDQSLIIGGVVISLIVSGMLYFINKQKK